MCQTRYYSSDFFREFLIQRFVRFHGDESPDIIATLARENRKLEVKQSNRCNRN